MQVEKEIFLRGVFGDIPDVLQVDKGCVASPTWFITSVFDDTTQVGEFLTSPRSLAVL